MSSLCRLMYWIAAGFFLCEVSIRSFGMPFTNDEDDRGQTYGDVGDEHNLFGVEGDRHKIFRVEDDAHKSGLENEEHNKAYEIEDGDACIPPTNSSAPVGLRGYRRYFANDSLIGRPVPCSRDDKICFRHNLVFDPSTDRCKPLWESCGEGTSLTVVNRTELEHGSGRVIGSCPKYDDLCPEYLTAYDGVCYEKKIVRDVICGCNAVLTRHVLGGIECRVQPASPINVQQPKEDGSCLIPDLNNPDPRHSQLLGDPFQFQFVIELNCRSNQATCFSNGMVFVAGYDGCHKHLERGPCAEDHVVALDLPAATQGRAEGTCVHVRGGCPKGYKRMFFDGECHEDREIKLVAPGEIVLDEFGRYFVSDRSERKFFNAAFDGNHTCIIEILIPTSPPHLPLNPFLPPCGPDNSGKCKLYEVESDPPKPDFNDHK